MTIGINHRAGMIRDYKRFNMTDLEKEIDILENIYSQPEKVRQRDLAHIAGISLGMTNSIVKRLVKKGFLSAKKLNHRNIHYAVTPAGINEIMKRSYFYFKRTIKNIVVYKDKIKTLVDEIQKNGFIEIILVGKSDLDFIVEHCCHDCGITFRKKKHAAINKNTKTGTGSFFIFNENYSENNNYRPENSILLFEKLK